MRKVLNMFVKKKPTTMQFLTKSQETKGLSFLKYNSTPTRTVNAMSAIVNLRSSAILLYLGCVKIFLRDWRRSLD